MKLLIGAQNMKRPITLLKKSSGLGLQLCEKIDSGTGVFLWILRNFWDYLFYRTPLGDCFWNIYIYKVLSHVPMYSSPVRKAPSFQSFQWISSTRFAKLIQIWQILYFNFTYIYINDFQIYIYIYIYIYYIYIHI